jgi:hypothetical protein
MVGWLALEISLKICRGKSFFDPKSGGIFIRKKYVGEMSQLGDFPHPRPGKGFGLFLCRAEHKAEES